VSKKAGLGVLKGRIYDGERADQPPIPNVILTVNGATAVTNQQGEFVFPNLKPGTYFLGIEQNTIGLHRVPAEKLPLRVDLKEGETKSSDIPVIPSAHISGEVAVWAHPKKGEDSPKREKGLGEVLVELKNAKEVVRDFTDANGKFSFRGLRPGKWTLKFHAKSLPAQHYFEKEQIQLDLKPGEERTLVGKVIRRVPEIRIIDEGNIKPEIRKSKKN
jgi:protocatechuate 3,4-dioxygenase beta subunit